MRKNIWPLFTLSAVAACSVQGPVASGVASAPPQMRGMREGMPAMRGDMPAMHGGAPGTVPHMACTHDSPEQQCHMPEHMRQMPGAPPGEESASSATPDGSPAVPDAETPPSDAGADGEAHAAHH